MVMVTTNLSEGLVDGVMGVDDPHVTPGNANVRATTRELGPSRAVPAVQVISRIRSGNIITVGAVDGLQTTRNSFPLVFARQHAVDCLISVDDPLLAVGANCDMGTSTREPVPATILVLEQLLRRVNADGAIMSPGVNLIVIERGKYMSMQTNQMKFLFAYLNAGTGHLVPSVFGGVPSEYLLGSVAAPDGIINASSSPDGGTREFSPSIVVIVPLVDRLAYVKHG